MSVGVKVNCIGSIYWKTLVGKIWLVLDIVHICIRLSRFGVDLSGLESVGKD